MPSIHRATFRLLAIACLALGLQGCWGSGSTQVPTPTFTVSGTVSGLTGSGLTLTNGSDSVAVNANATTFTFPTAVTQGNSYAVAVKTQPNGATCTLTGASGTVSANVTTVQVACVPIKHLLGGTIAGLTAGGLVLANGADTVGPSSGATSFAFAQTIAEGNTYAVSVQTQPSGANCTVAGGSGTMGTTDINSIQVTCTSTQKPAAWSSPQLIGVGGYVLLVSDPSDAAFFLAWSDFSPGTASHARRYTDASGWSAPVTVADVGHLSCCLTGLDGLGFDKLGNGFAMLRIADTTEGFSRYTPGVGWSAVLPLGSATMLPPVVTPPNVTVNFRLAGLGLAVFGDGSAAGLVFESNSYSSGGVSLHEDGGFFSVAARAGSNLLTESSALATGLPQSSSDALPYTYPQGGGTATGYYYPVSVFVQSAIAQSPSAPNYAVRYVESTSAPTGATDPNGNPLSDNEVVLGVTLWSNGIPSNITAGSYRVGSSACIGLIGGGISVSDNGSALIAWSSITSGTPNVVQVFASRYTGSGWSAPQLLYSGDAGGHSSNDPCPAYPVTAVNANGDGVVFFGAVQGVMVTRLNGNTGVFAQTFPLSTDLSDAVAAGLDVAGNAYFLNSSLARRLSSGATSWDAGALAVGGGSGYSSLALDRDGNPMVAWYTSVGGNIFASRYH